MKKLFSKKEYINLKKGYTLLFAALISSLLLSIGVAVFNISIKEFKLSATGRESQFAFYAADTGSECALYWDFQDAAFATATPAASINCGGSSLSVTSTNPSPQIYVRKFRLDFLPEQPYCVDVVVTKTDSPPGAGMPVRTEIQAFGRNSCDLSAPRRVERALRVRY